ncbi:MAG TPA: phosphotransferase [Thermoanaerobaculia bacterium]
MRRKSRRWRRRVPEDRNSLRKTWDAESEPQLEGDESVEWGGQSIWAVGFTPGGAPYGLTIDEYRESSAEYARYRGADWAEVKRLLGEVLARKADRAVEIDIGWVRYLDRGLCRKAFTAEVEVAPDPSGLSGTYVILLPLPDAEPSFDARARFEARLLAHLATLDLPLRIPRILGLLSCDGRPATVETLVHGIPLDLRAGRQPGVRPWDVVAQVAATVHALDVDALFLPGGPIGEIPDSSTRREYALAQLSILEGRPEPLLQDVHAWALEHLPPTERSVLVHGDLLGQNILLAPRELPGLIDWEYARLGDPAYDLAIVTRGARRPFQLADGLDRLLDAYAARSWEVRKEHVRLYELCLLARGYLEALEGGVRTHPPEVMLDRLRGAFRRVTERG